MSMRDLLTVIGLIINMCGCCMLYFDSARVSSSISVAGPRLGHETDEVRAKLKDSLIAWWGRVSIAVIGLGFAFQLVAINFGE
jgi:hypothetical protein